MYIYISIYMCVYMYVSVSVSLCVCLGIYWFIDVSILFFQWEVDGCGHDTYG